MRPLPPSCIYTADRTTSPQRWRGRWCHRRPDACYDGLGEYAAKFTHVSKVVAVDVADRPRGEQRLLTTLIRLLLGMFLLQVTGAHLSRRRIFITFLTMHGVSESNSVYKAGCYDLLHETLRDFRLEAQDDAP